MNCLSPWLWAFFIHGSEYFLLLLLPEVARVYFLANLVASQTLFPRHLIPRCNFCLSSFVIRIRRREIAPFPLANADLLFGITRFLLNIPPKMAATLLFFHCWMCTHFTVIKFPLTTTSTWAYHVHPLGASQHQKLSLKWDVLISWPVAYKQWQQAPNDHMCCWGPSSHACVWKMGPQISPILVAKMDSSALNRTVF